MNEIIKKYNFLTFNKEEIERMSEDDLQMGYIYNYIKNNYKYLEHKVYYTSHLSNPNSSIYDLFLIEENGNIIRYIEIVNNCNIKQNTNNMTLALERIRAILERRQYDN